jgi:hypothetical protein
MVEKFELIMSLTFLVAHFAMAATMGDWFRFKKEFDMTIGTSSPPVACTVYKGEAYNLFGSLCGISVASFEKYVMTLQILLPAGFGFSLVLFFLVLFRRMSARAIRLTAGVVFAIELAASVLWQVSVRSDLPTDMEVISYYGVGWIMTIVTMVCSLFVIIVV